MLSCNAKNILRALREATDHELTYNALMLDLHLSWNDVKSASDMLVEQRLAFRKEKGAFPVSSVVLNENGRDLRRYRFNNAVSFLFRSVIVPIFVAAVVAFLTARLS